MKKLVYVYVACMLALLAACGTSGRQTGRSKSVAAVMEKKDTLTYEQWRKYDYYFLEAVRMKQKGEYDAAFELYKHCLDINPNSAPALYEIRISGTSRHWLRITSANGICRKRLPFTRTWRLCFLHGWTR